MKYRAFKDLVALNRVVLPNHGAAITFCITMPKSWSKKKKELMNGRGHQGAGDIDNYLKAILDAVHKDDRYVWHIAEIKKIWGYEGYIEID
jgi:Holliday junction resolvase RusA-like endonuclease